MEHRENSIHHSMPFRQYLPWFTILFLTAVFFLADHDLKYTEKIQTIGELSAEEVIQRATEGNLLRRFVYVSLGLFSIFTILRFPGDRFRLNGFLGWLILFYLFWVFLSVMWSHNSAVSIRRAVLLAILMIGAYGMSLRLSVYQVMCWIFCSTLTYLALGILAEISFGTFHPFSYGHRFSGTVHPNFQSLNCSFLLLSSLFLQNFHPERKRLLLSITAFALLFLVMTKSRTALGALIAAPTMYLILKRSLKDKLALTVSIVTPVVLLLLFSPVILPALEQGILLKRADLTPETTLSLTGRIPLWRENFVYIMQNPILGYGYDCFWALKETIMIAENQEWAATHGHSAYFDLLLGLGIVGMITYVLILGAGIRRSFIYEKMSGYPGFRYFGIILLFCMLDGFLESIIIAPNHITFCIFLILMRYGWQRELLSTEDMIQYNAALGLRSVPSVKTESVETGDQ